MTHGTHPLHRAWSEAKQSPPRAGRARELPRRLTHLAPTPTGWGRQRGDAASLLVRLSGAADRFHHAGPARCAAGAALAAHRHRACARLQPLPVRRRYSGPVVLPAARVEAALPADADFRGVQAIVVLGGDVRAGNGADIADALGPLSLERVVLAARAYRQLRLPVAVSGGRVGQRPDQRGGADEGRAGNRFRRAGRPGVRTRSRTTWENAVYTARLLQPAGVRTVVLVSQAWHLPRAIWAFERAGLKARPWPAPRDRVRAVPATRRFPAEHRRAAGHGLRAARADRRRVLPSALLTGEKPGAAVRRLVLLWAALTRASGGPRCAARTRSPKPGSCWPISRTARRTWPTASTATRSPTIPAPQQAARERELLFRDMPINIGLSALLPRPGDWLTHD